MQLPKKFPLVTFETKTKNVVQSLEFIDSFNYPEKLMVIMLNMYFHFCFFY